MSILDKSCCVCSNDKEQIYYKNKYRCDECTFEILTKYSYKGIQNTIYNE